MIREELAADYLLKSNPDRSFKGVKKTGEEIGTEGPALRPAAS